MDRVTQSNAASAEETAASAEQLDSQAAALQDAVFRLCRIVGGNLATSNRLPSQAITPASPLQRPKVPAVKTPAPAALVQV